MLYCQSCGAEARPSFRFCPACGGMHFSPGAKGTAVQSSAGRACSTSTTTSRAMSPTPAIASSIDVSAMQYAGFWRRAAAFGLDQSIMIAVFSLPVALVFKPGSEQALLLMNLLGVVVAWLYYALQEASQHQATFGKRIVGLVVADMNGQRLSFARASGHHFARIPSAMVLLAGYFMALFTERRQTLHDRMAGVVVLARMAK